MFFFCTDKQSIHRVELMLYLNHSEMRSDRSNQSAHIFLAHLSMNDLGHLISNDVPRHVLYVKSFFIPDI